MKKGTEIHTKSAERTESTPEVQKGREGTRTAQKGTEINTKSAERHRMHTKSAKR